MIFIYIDRKEAEIITINDRKGSEVHPSESSGYPKDTPVTSMFEEPQGNFRVFQ